MDLYSVCSQNKISAVVFRVLLLSYRLRLFIMNRIRPACDPTPMYDVDDVGACASILMAAFTRSDIIGIG
jgi:hypothetical protein